MLWCNNRFGGIVDYARRLNGYLYWDSVSTSWKAKFYDPNTILYKGDVYAVV